MTSKLPKRTFSVAFSPGERSGSAAIRTATFTMARLVEPSYFRADLRKRDCVWTSSTTSKKFQIRFGKSPSTYKNALRENRRAFSITGVLAALAGQGRGDSMRQQSRRCEGGSNEPVEACLMGTAGRAQPSVLLLSRSRMRLLPMPRGYWQLRGRIRFGGEASVARRFPGAKLQVCRATWQRIRAGLGRWQVGKPLAIQRWHNVWIPFERRGPSFQ